MKIPEPGTYTDAATLMRSGGGKWLGAARRWLQWHKHNGDSVTWGSEQELTPAMTVREVEDLAATVAAAVLNELADRGPGGKP